MGNMRFMNHETVNNTNLGYKKSIKKTWFRLLKKKIVRDVIYLRGGSREEVLELLYKTNLQGS